MPSTAGCSRRGIAFPDRRQRRPADPRRRAQEILVRVETAGAYASILLERSEGFRDARDVALLNELVLGVLRRRSALDHAISGVSSRALDSLQPEVRTALRIAAYSMLYLDRIPDHAAVNVAVESVKNSRRGAAAGFVNGVLRALARRGAPALPAHPEPGDVEALALHHSHPPWWVRRVVDRRGFDGAGELLAANNAPAATVLRANTRKASVEDLQASLREDGVEVEPCRYAVSALRVVSGAVQRSRALREGIAWVQDEASQLAGALIASALAQGGLPPAPAPRVADLCAAPGGKTMQLADVLDAPWSVVAVDRHLGRLRRMRGNLRRTGFDRVYPVQADMESAPGPFGTGFAGILVDAPCSGSGTWRRHPEIRWRLAHEDLGRLADRQLRLLATAAGLAAAGCRVVYSVCSMEPEEGEEVVHRFLDGHPAFRLADPAQWLPGACRPLVGSDGFLRTSPDRDGLDGFFAALLIRG